MATRNEVTSESFFHSIPRTVKNLSLLDLLRVGTLVWAGYYFCTMFASNILLHIHGMVFAYAGFYWLVNGFMLAIICLYAWKPRNILSKLAMIPVYIYLAYSWTRFFIDQYFVLNFPMIIVHLVLVVFALVNLLWIIIGCFKYLFSRRMYQKFRSFRAREWFMIIIIGFFLASSLLIWLLFGVASQFPVFFIGGLIAGIIFVIAGLLYKHRTLKMKIISISMLVWLFFTCWSYFGFSQRYMVSDPKQPEFSVAFWGSPSAGTNISHYSTPEGIEEMQKYQLLNATFYNTINYNTLQNNSKLAIYEQMIQAWEPYGVKIIYDLTPLNYDQDPPAGDFVSYYYLDQMNKTARALMDWLEPLNLSNFRGISFDVEGPKYKTNNSLPQEVSLAQYKAALKSYDGILAEFKSRFPNCTTQLIQMDGIIFDFYDGDHDLDIAQRTVSVEMENWDWHGFMTYHINPSPSTSSYSYVYYMQNMVEQFGPTAQPWVGWWYKDGDIDLPGVYEHSLEQVKIAKSFGVKEVVLAPVRNFIGQDHNQTKIISRLNDLITIKGGFSDFFIPILHNQRLYNNWDLYWEKIVPNYLITNNNVVKDLLFGTPFQWFGILQVMIATSIIMGMLYVFYRRK